MPIDDERGAASGAERTLVVALGDLHLQAGKPSARAIARALGSISHTTVTEALNGRRVPSWPVLARIVKALGGDEEAFQRIWMDIEYQRSALTSAPDDTTLTARTVFVVHGRDERARRTVFDFLRSLDLRPVEWENLVAATRQSTPSLLTIIQTAISQAQATVVLLTPDDLLTSYSNDPANPQTAAERRPSPNVLIELGMALMAAPDRTIILQLGELAPIGDLGGLNVIRLDGSQSASQKLVQRLKMAGCMVDDSGSDWQSRLDYAEADRSFDG